MLLPIITGLSIALMDTLDAYRANSVRSIASYEFPEDIQLALRQEVNMTVDAAVAAISKNPRPAPTVAPVVTLPIPQVIARNQEVFGFEVAPAAPTQDAQFSA